MAAVALIAATIQTSAPVSAAGNQTNTVWFTNAVPEVSATDAAIAYCGGPGQPNCAGSYAAEVSWGTQDRSGLLYNPSASSTSGSQFQVGTLTHRNRVVGLTEAITKVTFNINLNYTDTTRNVSISTSGSAGLKVNETSNLLTQCPFAHGFGPNCPDRIELTAPYLNATKSAGNVLYRLDNLMFRDPRSNEIKQYMTTKEGEQTATALYADLTREYLVVADAGPDQTVDERTAVQLDGSGSRVTGLLYKWTQTGGPAVVLSDDTAVRPTFDAPELTESASVTFQLEVRDKIEPNHPEMRKTDDVTINIIDINDPPVVDAGGPYTVPEGSTVDLDEATAFDPDGDDLIIQWTPETQLTNADQIHPTFKGIDDAVDTLTVTVTDPFGEQDSAQTQVTTTNVAPATDLGADEIINENDVFQRSGLTYFDPGLLDTHSATVDYGDGSGEQELTLQPIDSETGIGSFELSHRYIDDDPSGTPSDTYTITVTIEDDDLGSTTETLNVTVNNLDPTTEAGDAETIDEGQTFSRNLSFDDIGTADTHTVTVDYGEGAGFEAATVDQAGKAYVLSHLYADDDPTATPQDDYTIMVRVEDDDGGVAEDEILLTVRDVAPDIEITGPALDGDLFAAPATINLTAPFTDPGVRDTFTCSIEWDEAPATNEPTPPPTEFTAPFSGTEGNCDATNVFENAGVYSIKVTVTDDDTLFDVAERTIVVYDPSAGFVTGGGYYQSPPGAYRPDPAATGKAHFAFVSQYRKGSPEGQTEFQFQAGDLNFHSESYEWLVVTGNATRAQYKGEGTINGESGFGFMLTAYDVAKTGAGNDKIRMKIWDTTTDEVIYDNRLDQPDDVDQADPQIIESGSIFIHTKGGKQ